MEPANGLIRKKHQLLADALSNLAITIPIYFLSFSFHSNFPVSAKILISKINVVSVSF